MEFKLKRNPDILETRFFFVTPIHESLKQTPFFCNVYFADAVMMIHKERMAMRHSSLYHCSA